MKGNNPAEQEAMREIANIRSSLRTFEPREHSEGLSDICCQNGKQLEAESQGFSPTHRISVLRRRDGLFCYLWLGQPCLLLS